MGDHCFVAEEIGAQKWPGEADSGGTRKVPGGQENGQPARSGHTQWRGRRWHCAGEGREDCIVEGGRILGLLG